jgi:hypothetical protein
MKTLFFKVFFLTALSAVSSGSVRAAENKQPLESDSCYKDEFYVVGEFLWWKAENQGFTIAFNQTVDTTTFPNVGKIVQFDTGWDPGFRIGMGWNDGTTDWDIEASWTWYNNNSKQTNNIEVAETSTGEGFYPLWPVAETVASGTDLGPYTEVKANWNLVLNAIDLDLSKTAFSQKNFSLNLIWGARGAWLYQTFHNHFFSPIATRVSVAIPDFEFDGKNNYWGIGPRTGIQSEWLIGKGFSFIGKVATALLYGQGEAKNLSKGPDSAGNVVVHHSFTQSFNQLAPYLQLLLGFKWKTYFRKRFSFGIQAAWEANYWWNQFNVPVSFERFASPMPSVGNSPLSIEGLNLSLQSDF